MEMMELIDKLQEHYKDFSKRMRGRIYYDDQETKTLLEGYTEELASFFSKELSKAREEGGESIIAQLSLSENMEKVERFFREAPIDYDDKCNLWFDFLSKLTTK